MSTSVSVQVGFNKKEVVKLSPMTPLSHIVNEVRRVSWLPGTSQQNLRCLNTDDWIIAMWFCHLTCRIFFATRKQTLDVVLVLKWTLTHAKYNPRLQKYSRRSFEYLFLLQFLRKHEANEIFVRWVIFGWNETILKVDSWLCERDFWNTASSDHRNLCICDRVPRMSVSIYALQVSFW